MEPARVDLVILNWNEREFLEDLILPSVAAQTYSDFRVIVADNGSDDDSLAYLAREWPEVMIVANSRNLGVTAGLNTGIRAASAEYVALVNNDVELDPAWLETLVATMDGHSEAAAAAGKLLTYHDRSVLDGAGDILGEFGLWGRRGHGQVDRGQYDEPGAIDGISAVAALYRREAFDVVGLLDEDLYAYFEDSDWSFRAGLAGYALRYEPAALACHIGGGTNKKRGDFELFHLQRNAFALIFKNWTGARIRAQGWSFLRFQLEELWRSRRDGTMKTRLRGWLAALRLMPAMLRKRRDVFSRSRPGGTQRHDHPPVRRPGDSFELI